MLKDSVRFIDKVNYKDSFVLRTKDSTIIIPKSDLNGSISNPCDSAGLKSFDYALGSGVHKLRVWSDGKTIIYSSTVDSLVSIIRNQDSYHKQEKDSFAIKEQTLLNKIQNLEKQQITVIKHSPTFFQSILRVLIGIIIGFILGKLLKIKIPFIN